MFQRTSLLSVLSHRRKSVVHEIQVESTITCAIFCQNDRLICGTSNGDIQIYTFPKLSLLHTFPAHAGSVNSLDVYNAPGDSASSEATGTSPIQSPSTTSSKPFPQSILVSGGSDSCVFVWDLVSLSILAVTPIREFATFTISYYYYYIQYPPLSLYSAPQSFLCRYVETET